MKGFYINKERLLYKQGKGHDFYIKTSQVYTEAFCLYRSPVGRRPGDPSELMGSRWRAMINSMARTTCFREEYYTGMRRYCSARKDSRQKPKKTIYGQSTVFLWYLWIDQFVWALAFCGLRRSCLAAMDCNGASQNIHMRKIGLPQGRVHACKCDIFHVLGTFDEAPVTLQSSWVRVDAQWSIPHGELVS